MTRIFLIILTFLLFLPACKTSKKAEKPIKKKSASFLLNQLKQQQIDYTWFSTKAKIRYKDNKYNQSFSTNIRIKKDSIIWMNASKLGYEAGRVLMRPDSIFILNRLEKQYFARDYQFLKEEYNLFVDFKTIQSLIIGEPMYLRTQNAKSKIVDNQYQLTTYEDGIQSDYWLKDKDFLISKWTIKEDFQARKMEIKMNEYKKLEQFYLAIQREIEMESEITGQANIQIQLSNPEVNIPKKTPFSVSSRYTRM